MRRDAAEYEAMLLAGLVAGATKTVFLPLLVKRQLQIKTQINDGGV